MIKLADIFEAVALLACMTFFLSKRVFSRSLSYRTVSPNSQRGALQKKQPPLLFEDRMRSSVRALVPCKMINAFNHTMIDMGYLTSLKKKDALFACNEAWGSMTSVAGLLAFWGRSVGVALSCLISYFQISIKIRGLGPW